MQRFRVVLALVLSLAAVMWAAPVLADNAPGSASVTITDTGFNPPSVTVAPGGSVTWTNQGSQVHTATSSGTVPASFDTGGLGNGQTKTWTFAQPGTYTYSSYPDCLNGNISATFQCGTYTVVVSPAVPSAAPSGATPSQPAATGTPAMTNANVTITDSGFSQHTIALTLNGTVTFVNTGSVVHNATSTSGAPLPFDTGGLAPGQSTSIQFSLPGTYNFNSATDCLNGNNNAAFSCGTPNAIIVAPVPAGATSASVPNIGTVFVYMKDDVGYQPASLTVKAGTTVTWLNVGANAHSVQSDFGVNPAFDSGGISEGGSFSVTFNTPGTYTYHSAADPVFSGTTQTGYRFTGKVIVTS